MVDDVKYNTNAHQMAIGSEVHMVARTELASNSDEAAASGPTPHAKPVPSRTIMSMFASLHRKLIVQQVRNGVWACARESTQGKKLH